MPDCVPESAKRKCGVACTVHVGSIKRAWYKDCKSGAVGTGGTYTEAINQTKRIIGRRPPLGITAEGESVQLGKYKPGAAKGIVRRKIEEQEEQGGGSGRATEAGPGDVSNLILGSPEDWSKALEGNCFGLPMECGSLAVIGGALVLLIIVMKVL